MEKEKCPQCHKLSNTVHQRPNSYAQEVADDLNAMWIACDECDYENKMDV